VAVEWPAVFQTKRMRRKDCFSIWLKATAGGWKVASLFERTQRVAPNANELSRARIIGRVQCPNESLVDYAPLRCKRVARGLLKRN